ncbi:hypothetical protein AAVH_32307 [Aphelenchoides avenae]|nr:hypothetical protein AAVH_32307 [Aphelenchus avenae]
MTAFLQTLSPETKRFLNQSAQQASSSATFNPSVVAASWSPVCNQMRQSSSNGAMSSLQVPQQNATGHQIGSHTTQAPTVFPNPSHLPPEALALAHQALMQQFYDLKQKLNPPKS